MSEGSLHLTTDDRKALEALEDGRLRNAPDVRATIAEYKKLRKEAIALLAKTRVCLRRLPRPGAAERYRRQALSDAPIATLEVHPVPEKLDHLRRHRSRL
jgi:hypothetical protein